MATTANGSTKSSTTKKTTAKRSTAKRSTSSSNGSGSTSRSAASRTTSRSTAQRKASTTRRNTTAKRTTTKSNARATSRNASRATARTQTSVAREAAQARNEAQTIVTRVGDVAERTVLTYVGATLTARDAVVEVVDTATDTTKLQRGLKQRRTSLERTFKGFERRGTTARNRVERELKKRRTRIERELRQRTDRVEKDAKSVGADARQLVKDVRRTEAVQSVNLVGATVENVAQGAVLNATKVAREVTGRVAKAVA